jgi:hypothetical protein
MFFVNVNRNLYQKDNSKKAIQNIKKPIIGKNLYMKNSTKIFPDEFSRKIFLEKFFFIFPSLAFYSFFENPIWVFAENLLQENLAFSTKSGLKIIDFVEGNSPMPQWGDFLIINYVLYRKTSQKIEKIDDTYQKKNPFLFIHGGGQTIKGLEEAVHSMKKGGKRRVIIPKELGYNSPGLGPVPPENWKRKKLLGEKEFNDENFGIIVDIELIDIKQNNYRQKLFISS